MTELKTLKLVLSQQASEPIAKLISESDPLFYVIECMPNMISPENVSNNNSACKDHQKKKL